MVCEKDHTLKRAIQRGVKQRLTQLQLAILHSILPYLHSPFLQAYNV